jgi:hypothetical protein
MAVRPSGARVRIRVGGAILLAQLVSVGYAHFGPAPENQSWVRKTLDGCSGEPVGCRRYFAWAPNDYVVEYGLRVQARGRVLTFVEAQRRYHLPRRRLRTGLYEDPPQRLIDAIEAYERSHDPDRRDRVRLTFTVNGGDRQEWRWPHA